MLIHYSVFGKVVSNVLMPFDKADGAGDAFFQHWKSLIPAKNQNLKPTFRKAAN